MEIRTLVGRLLAEARARDSAIDPELARLLRRRAGLSQEKLAQVVEVSRPTVTRWERGTRKPSGPALARYRAALEALADAGEHGADR